MHISLYTDRHTEKGYHLPRLLSVGTRCISGLGPCCLHCKVNLEKVERSSVTRDICCRLISWFAERSWKELLTIASKS
jgi:hypothetical protein